MGLLNQTNSFLFLIVAGLVISLVYDFFRIKRIIFGSGKLSIFFEDFLFWFIAGAILIAIVYYKSNGEFRLYMLVGLVFGILFYVLLFSKNFINTTIWTYNAMEKIISYIFVIFKRKSR